MEQIHADNADDITLYTDEEQVSVKSVDAVFEQHCPLRGETRRFTLFNGQHCHQQVKRRYGSKTRHRINLQILDSTPRRHRNLARGWLIISLILGILSFLLVYRQIHSDPPYSGPSLSLIVLALSLFVIALLLTVFLSRHRIRYYSRYGRIPLIELIGNRPNTTEVTDFLRRLCQQILLSRHNHPRSATQALSFELRDLRRLRDEGVITNDDYEQAKQRIFAHPAYRA